MKKYIFGAVLSLGILVSPAFTQAAGLTSAQISAIIGLLQSFGADQATINNVQTSLNGGTPTGGGTQAWCHTFNTDLKINDESIEVRLLSVALSKEGFHRDSNNDWTGFSEEVASAVVQFQAKYGIRQTGYVGPITRAKLNALYSCHSSQSTSSSSNNNISQLTKTIVLNGFDQCGIQFNNGEFDIGYDKYTQLERTCSAAVSFASMSAEGMVLADLDGDGINEALASVGVVRASSGGALYVFKNVNNVARAVDSVILGKENGKVVSVNKNIVVIETDGAMGYTPHQETYKFVDNKLVKQ